MPNILIVATDYSSSVSCVVEKNLNALQKVNPALEHRFCREDHVSLDDLLWCDTLICVRGCEKQTLNILETASILGKFTVYFLDDDLLHVPQDINKIIQYYFSNCDRQQTLVRCLSACNALWSHNPKIIELYRQYTKGKAVCSPMYYEPLDLPVLPSETVNVLFAGSTTHRTILRKYIYPAIRRLAAEFIDTAIFTIIGPSSDLIGDNIHCLPYFDDYQSFLSFVSQHSFQIGIAAVQNRAFDQCKSFIKFFDYTNFHAAGIYSDTMPYTMIVKDRVNGFLTDNTEESWYNTLKYAITHPEECEKCVSNAKKLLAESYNEFCVSEYLQKEIPEMFEKHARDFNDKQLLRLRIEYDPAHLVKYPEHPNLFQKIKFYNKKAACYFSAYGIKGFPKIVKKSFYRSGQFVIHKVKNLNAIRTEYGNTAAIRSIFNKLRGKSALYGIRKPVLPNNDRDIDYNKRGKEIFWRQQNEYSESEFAKRAERLKDAPLISIAMPLYNPPIRWLKTALRSLFSQYYKNWQLCAVDDGSGKRRSVEFIKRIAKYEPRIKFFQQPKNSGISAAMNRCIAIADGDYIALMDQDDALTEDALLWIAEEIVSHPDAALIYTDECKCTAEEPPQLFDFYCKPDWSPELLLSHMYTSHLSVYKKSTMCALGGFRSEFDFAQDHDLALRLAETGLPVRHIPRILYFWRALPSSGAGGGKDFARKVDVSAIRTYLQKIDPKAQIKELPYTNQPVFSAVRNTLVGIVIPSDNYNALTQCMNHLIKKTDFPKIQVIPVTNSAVAQKLQTYKYRKYIKICKYDKPFNFSDKCNAGAQIADGQILVFYNDDVIPHQRDWLSTLIGPLKIPGVGAVSPMLLQANKKTLQYGGMIAGTPGICGTAFNNFAADRAESNPFKHCLIRNISILSGACFAIKKDLFLQTLFDAEHTPNGNSDVDLSFKLLEKGLRCVYQPHSVVVHVGNHSWDPKNKIDKSDIFMLKRWGRYLEEDPYFPDPLKALMYEDFRFRFKIYAAPTFEQKKGSKDILFLTHELTLTGAPLVLKDFIACTQARGDFPVVVSPKDGPLRRSLQEMGITVIIDESMDEGFWLFRKFARNFDLVVANTLACHKAVEALNGDCCPVIWWIHESSFAFSLFENRLPKKLENNIHLFSAWNVINDQLRKYYPQQEILSLPCCTALPTAPESKVPFTKKDGKTLFLCIGTVEPRKGQQLIGQAIAFLSEEEKQRCSFLFIGNIKNNMTYYRQLYKTLNNEEDLDFMFLPPLPHDEICNFYQKADCILVPSYDDPGPLIPVEAMSCKKPVIISDGCGASAYIDNEKNGLIFPSGNAAALAELIRFALGSPQELEDIGKNSFAIYEKYFSERTFEKNIGSLLNKLIAQN